MAWMWFSTVLNDTRSTSATAPLAGDHEEDRRSAWGIPVLHRPVQNATVLPMARPRTFEEEQALEAAMRAFWRRGYEATSTQDLCAATGLGRSSVYNAFDSKRELFTRALRRYM